MNFLSGARLKRLVRRRLMWQVDREDRTHLRALLFNDDAVDEVSAALNVYAEGFENGRLALQVGLPVKDENGNWQNFAESWADRFEKWVTFLLENWEEVLNIIVTIVRALT